MSGDFKMPGWASDNATSVAREAAPYRTMTPSQRLKILDSLCRDAMVILASRDDRERVLTFKDPLPKNSDEILKRLREVERQRRARGG